MTSLILWYQLDESIILALRHPAVPLLQPHTVMVSDCCNCSAPSSYNAANQLSPLWLVPHCPYGASWHGPITRRHRDLIHVVIQWQWQSSYQCYIQDTTSAECICLWWWWVWHRFINGRMVMQWLVPSSDSNKALVSVHSQSCSMQGFSVGTPNWFPKTH